MRSFLNTVRAIFVKDLVSELRAKQILVAMIMLGFLIAWVFRIATQANTADTSATAAAALLVSLLFSAILASERLFAVEQQNDCISALLLAPVDAGDIYIAKLLVNITMLSIFEIVAAPAVLVLFDVDMAGRWLELAAVLLTVNIGISATGTLLGCMVQGTKAANCLLSILVMVILCPMIIPAISALLILFGGIPAAPVMNRAEPASDFRRAVGFLAAFDAIYVTVCWLLFDFVVVEQEK